MKKNNIAISKTWNMQKAKNLSKLSPITKVQEGPRAKSFVTKIKIAFSWPIKMKLSYNFTEGC